MASHRTDHLPPPPCKSRGWHDFVQLGYINWDGIWVRRNAWVCKEQLCCVRTEGLQKVRLSERMKKKAQEAATTTAPPIAEKRRK